MSPLEKVFSLTSDPQLSPSMSLLRVHVLSFDTVSLSVSERSFKKRDPSLWTSPEKFVVLGDQT